MYVGHSSSPVCGAHDAGGGQCAALCSHESAPLQRVRKRPMPDRWMVSGGTPACRRRTPPRLLPLISPTGMQLAPVYGSTPGRTTSGTTSTINLCVAALYGHFWSDVAVAAEPSCPMSVCPKARTPRWWGCGQLGLQCAASLAHSGPVAAQRRPIQTGRPLTAPAGVTHYSGSTVVSGAFCGALSAVTMRVRHSSLAFRQSTYIRRPPSRRASSAEPMVQCVVSCSHVLFGASLLLRRAIEATSVAIVTSRAPPLASTYPFDDDPLYNSRFRPSTLVPSTYTTNLSLRRHSRPLSLSPSLCLLSSSHNNLGTISSRTRIINCHQVLS